MALSSIAVAVAVVVVFVVVVLSCAPAFASPPAAPGNVILFIGDGFGPTHVALGLSYARRVEGRELSIEALMKDGNTGYAMPVPEGSIVIDSAAGATQMATGERVLNETMGMSASGYPIPTIVEWAEARGLATGLVSTMRLSHATPAAFASHQVSRYRPESEIFDEILGGHDIEVLLGGGARALVPRGRRVSELLPGIEAKLDGASNREDDQDRLAQARERGYRIVAERKALARESATASKLLGLFSASHLPYVSDRRYFGLDAVPTLPEMTRAALDVLARSKKGFFLMVEGGNIDYAGHDNDAGSMLQEILELDAAVQVGIDFQNARPETLIVVTADHGTGGFSFTYGDWGPPVTATLPSGLEYRTDHQYPTAEALAALGRQRASYDTILQEGGSSPERLIDAVRRITGFTLTPEEARGALARDSEGHAWTIDFRPFYGDEESNPSCLLGRALAAKTYVVWSTGGHTIEPVLTFGRGPGAERLRGVYDDTFLYTVMKETLAGRP
jgi:alkaline phosphatase